MSEWSHQTWLRLKSLIWRPQLDRDLEDELQFHLAMREEKRQAQGLAPAEARSQTRQAFGNVGLLEEACRDLWTFSWLETILQDLRYGVRMLRRSPVFTVVAALSLALGIGANTAIFTVIDALLLKTLPVQRAEQLVTFNTDFVGNPYPDFPYPMFEYFRDRTKVFSGMSAICNVDRSHVTVNGPGGGLDAGQLRVGMVSGDYFSMLGVNAVIGRSFTKDDDRIPGGHPVAVISYGYWKRRLALSPDVVGRTFTLNRTTYIILGVAPQRFTGDVVGQPTDLWIPITMQDQVMLERPGLLTNPNPPWVRILARLKPEITVKQARANALLVYRQMLRESAGSGLAPQVLQEIERVTLELTPASRGFAPERQSLAKPLTVLMIVVGLVLLIACANVANLLLARAGARQREMAVRLALGAGRGRILRQLMTESVLLAIIAGAVGTALAALGTRVLGKMHPMATALDLHPDARVLTFTAALCLLTAVLFGLAPALRSSKAALVARMKGDAKHARFGLGKLLVVSQVALSLALLIGAALFVRTLRNLKSQDLGFERAHVLMIWTSPSQGGRNGAALADLFKTAQERVSSLPGVLSASPSDSGLLNGNGGSPVKVPGYTRKSTDDYFVSWKLVAPRFFDTVGMPLVAGRDFTALDTEKAPRVAIINEAMALHYFGRRSVVGAHFGMRRDRGDEIEIVGVAKDAKYNTLRESNVSMIYIPYRQDLSHLYDMCLAVHTTSDSPGLTGRIRDELRSIDPHLPIVSIDSMEQDVDKTLAIERLIAWVASFFGGLAVLLACIGLYGVMSYVAVRKTNEIGIRFALGATRSQVLRSVLKEGMLLVLAGIAIGVPATLAATRLITSLLFGVKPADPLTIGLAITLMIAVAAVGGFLPAHRASSVDPMMALRYE
jgi:predicted permease